MQAFNHQVIVRRGILEEECQTILKKFFQELRERNRIEKQRRREMQAAEAVLQIKMDDGEKAAGEENL